MGPLLALTKNLASQRVDGPHKLGTLITFFFQLLLPFQNQPQLETADYDLMAHRNLAEAALEFWLISSAVGVGSKKSAE